MTPTSSSVSSVPRSVPPAPTRCRIPQGRSSRLLRDWLAQLHDSFLEGGSMPTSHEQLRGYVRATFEFAVALHPAAVPDNVDARALKFAAAGPPM